MTYSLVFSLQPCVNTNCLLKIFYIINVRFLLFIGCFAYARQAFSPLFLLPAFRLLSAGQTLHRYSSPWPGSSHWAARAAVPKSKTNGPGSHGASCLPRCLYY